MNEDEVEFLDSILERTRAEEDRVKKETQEGLALFRQQQEEADKNARRLSGAAIEEAPLVEDESWAAGRKRKRAKAKEALKGVKVRRSSTVTEATQPLETKSKIPATPDKTATSKLEIKMEPASSPVAVKQESEQYNSAAVVKEEESPKSSKGTKMGLVDYGSDEDDW